MYIYIYTCGLCKGYLLLYNPHYMEKLLPQIHHEPFSFEFLGKTFDVAVLNGCSCKCVVSIPWDIDYIYIYTASTTRVIQENQNCTSKHYPVSSNGPCSIDILIFKPQFYRVSRKRLHSENVNIYKTCIVLMCIYVVASLRVHQLHLCLYSQFRIVRANA